MHQIIQGGRSARWETGEQQSTLRLSQAHAQADQSEGKHLDAARPAKPHGRRMRERVAHAENDFFTPGRVFHFQFNPIQKGRLQFVKVEADSFFHSLASFTSPPPKALRVIAYQYGNWGKTAFGFGKTFGRIDAFWLVTPGRQDR